MQAGDKTEPKKFWAHLRLRNLLAGLHVEIMQQLVLIGGLFDQARHTDKAQAREAK